MHNYRTLLAALAMATALIATPLAAQDTTVADLQKSADTVAESLASALPFNSTLGLNWSDAYIKKFPHFGAGIMLGATTIDADDIKTVLTDLGYEDIGDLGEVLPLPAAAIEGRLGGFVWPFDIGFKVGFIPESAGDALASSGLGLDYFLFGFDVRYALLEGKAFLPKLSVGGGFNFLRGGVSATTDQGQSFTFNDAEGDPHTIEATDPEVGLEWDSKVIDFKAQASWKFLIFTPYIGLGLSHGNSSAGYYVKSRLEYDGDPVSEEDVAAIKEDLEAYNEYLADIGESTIDIPDISATGIESSLGVKGWATRAFGGMSLTPFPFVRIDITGLYNFADGTYGGSLGTRIQF